MLQNPDESSAKDSQRCLVGVSQGNPLKGFCLFISGLQITWNRRNLVKQCILNVISVPKCFKTRFYED